MTPRALTLRDAVADLHRQVHAPDWAASNLDALADVLGDLSWLPPGPVLLRVPALAGEDLTRLLAVLIDLEAATAGTPRPVRVVVG